MNPFYNAYLDFLIGLAQINNLTHESIVRKLISETGPKGIEAKVNYNDMVMKTAKSGDVTKLRDLISRGNYFRSKNAWRCPAHRTGHVDIAWNFTDSCS